MSITVDRVIRSKRRTIALIVEDNGSLTVRAPMRMSAVIIQEFVAKHANWVEKKQAEMRAIKPVQPKQYQTGETFLYLGRKYALEFVQDQQKKLVLDDRLLLAESVRDNAEQVFVKWYRQQARLIIEERVKFFAEKYMFTMIESGLVRHAHAGARAALKARSAFRGG